ncbi:MAG: hypothetical protein JSU86_06825, partial [Phycisphaerales bacterium]
WYVPRRTLGFGQRASQGSGFFVAPNPPFGAVFTYYLKDSIQTRKEKRQEKEKRIAKKGGDTPTPGWDALRAEQLEEKPAIMLTVRNSAGNAVRHLVGPPKKGIHRVSWSLTYPRTDPWSPPREREERRFSTRNPDDGVLVAPGTYTVHLAKRREGKWTDLGKSQTFKVVPLRDGGTIPGMTPEEYAEFVRDYAAVMRSVGGVRSVLRDTADRLKAIRQTLDRSTVSDPKLGEQVRDMERRIAAMRETLEGSRQRSEASDPGPVSINRRLNVVRGSVGSTLHGPTAMHREAYSIAKRQVVGLKKELDQLVETELPDLERRLDESGVPWTPGRNIPGD